MKMFSPIKIEIKVGNMRYDASKLAPDVLAEVITHINAVQQIMDSQNKPQSSSNELSDEEE